MIQIIDLFKDAIVKKDKAYIETFICLFPKLSYEPEAEEYLREVVKKFDVGHFKTLWHHGDWTFDSKSFPKSWSFLDGAHYKSIRSILSQPTAQGMTEAQASVLKLSEELTNWFARALYLIVGQGPIESNSTLKYVNKKESIQSPHFRFLINDKSQYARSQALLSMLNIKCYANMTKGRQFVLTVPIHSFTKIFEVMEFSMWEASPIDFSRYNLSINSHRDMLATNFDVCFNLDKVMTDIKSRVSIYKGTFSSQDEEFHSQGSALGYASPWIENIESSYNCWIHKMVSDIVPYGLFYKDFSEQERDFKFIGQLMGVPQIDVDTDLSQLTSKQKACLFLACVAPETLTQHHQVLLQVDNLGDYIQHIQETLSQFIPEYIQNLKEITPWQEPYSPSYSSETPPLEFSANSLSVNKALEQSLSSQDSLRI